MWVRGVELQVDVGCVSCEDAHEKNGDEAGDKAEGVEGVREGEDPETDGVGDED